MEPIMGANTAWFANNLPVNLAKTFPTMSQDNPFDPFGVGIFTTYDYDHKRWIIFKKDARLIDPLTSNQFTIVNDRVTRNGIPVDIYNDPAFENISWTLSYSPIMNQWVSLHPYKPLVAFTHGTTFITVHKDTVSLWRHNGSTRRSFYGVKTPFIIEPVYKVPNEYPLKIDALKYIADSVILSTGEEVTSFDFTFQKAWVYNNYQFSGELDLLIEDENNLSTLMMFPKTTANSKLIPIRFRNNTWSFSDFPDIVSVNNQPIFVKAIGTVNQKAINPLAIDYNRSYLEELQLQERWAKVRLIFDHPADRDIKFYYLVPVSRLNDF